MRIARRNVETLEQLDQWLEFARKCRFKETNEELESISIDNLFDRLVKNKEGTCYTRGGHHCPDGRARSFNDLVLVYKYYNPNNTFRDIIKIVLNYYVQECKKKSFFEDIAYCPDIRKYNFRLTWYLNNDGYFVVRFVDSIKSDFQALYPNIDRDALEHFFNALLKEADIED